MRPRGLVRAHRHAAAAALLLAAVACGAEPDGRTIGDGIDDPTPSASHQPGAPRAGGIGGPRTSITPSATPPATQTGSLPPSPVYADAGGVGAMARTYLRAQPARRLRVEVDYVEGRRPSDGALEHLRGVLERDLAKPDGVVVLVGNEIPAERSVYTFDQIDALERAHRGRASEGSTATMWLVYLNGELEDDPQALGVAYRASAAAIFRDRVDRATTAAVQSPAIERAVLTHEVGHLLALVNLGYESPHEREDPNSPGHSTEAESVMRAAVEDLSLVALLSGGPPDDFDQFDRDDLDGLREGRL